MDEAVGFQGRQGNSFKLNDQSNDNRETLFAANYCLQVKSCNRYNIFDSDCTLAAFPSLIVAHIVSIARTLSHTFIRLDMEPCTIE